MSCPNCGCLIRLRPGTPGEVTFSGDPGKPVRRVIVHDEPRLVEGGHGWGGEEYPPRHAVFVYVIPDGSGRGGVSFVDTACVRTRELPADAEAGKETKAT